MPDATWLGMEPVILQVPGSSNWNDVFALPKAGTFGVPSMPVIKMVWASRMARRTVGRPAIAPPTADVRMVGGGSR